MLELSILALIVLAGIYWTALWLMGRHEDVLYGDFVSSAGSAGLPPPPAPEPPPRLVAPEIPRRPRGASHVAPRDIFAIRAVAGQDEIAARNEITRDGAAVPPHSPTRPVMSRPISPPSAPMTVPVVTSVRNEPKGRPLPPPVQATAVEKDGPTSVKAPPMVMPRPAFISQLAALPRQSAPARDDLLASLLETIKRDLGDTVGKQR